MKKKDFCRNFVSAMATAASLATLISFLYDWHAACFSACTLILLALSILGLCLLYAWWMVRRKSKIELEFNDSFRLTVTFGDLFNTSHEGIIVVPVNRYFDTEVSNGIVSRKSVVGIFINKYWQDRVDELNEKIAKALSQQVAEEDVDRKAGNKKKYKFGTCADIKDGGKTYVLVATTDKLSNGKSVLSKKDYTDVLECLLSHLESLKPQSMVYMPLFGAGRGKMKRPLRRILAFLIDTIDFKHSNLSFPHGVNIVIKQKYKEEVNLNEIKNHFESTLKD